MEIPSRPRAGLCYAREAHDKFVVRERSRESCRPIEIRPIAEIISNVCRCRMAKELCGRRNLETIGSRTAHQVFYRPRVAIAGLLHQPSDCTIMASAYVCEAAHFTAEEVLKPELIDTELGSGGIRSDVGQDDMVLGVTSDLEVSP